MLKILATHLDEPLEKYFRAEYGDNFITFGTSPGADIIVPSSVCSYKEIIDRLPAGWYPDILLINFVEHWGFNIDIMEIDCLTVAIVIDWMHYYDAVKAASQVFDVFIVWGKRIERIIRKLGCRNVYYQIYSFVPPDFLEIPQQEKKYDITFIGCINNRLWPRRSFLLERLALLGNKYNVNIQSGIWGEEYIQILKQSKIVFNCTVVEAINSRFFDVMATGSFLLTNENEEASLFFDDNVHLGLYTEDNLEERIEYFLQNDAEREKIAKKGYEEVMQNHTLQVRAEQYMQILNSLNIKEKIYSRLIRKPDKKNALYLAKACLPKGKTTDFFDVLANSDSSNSSVIDNMKAIAFTVAMHFATDDKTCKELVDNAIIHFEKSNSIYACLNLAVLYINIRDYDRAYKKLIEAKSLLNSNFQFNDHEVALLDLIVDYKISLEDGTTELTPSLAPISKIAGVLYKMLDSQGDSNFFVEYLKKIIDFQLWLLHVRKDQYQEAFNLIAGSAQENDEAALINYIYGIYHEAYDKLDEALNFYIKAYKSKAFYMESRYNASRVLRKLGMLEKADALDAENKLLEQYKTSMNYLR